MRWGVVLLAVILLIVFVVMNYGEFFASKSTKFVLDRECNAMRCYKIRSRDEKILYQPAQSDVKKRFKLSNQLQFTPSVHKMCETLKSTNCSFTFKITQSYDMNISIGICDRGDKGIGGIGAIYYTGHSGKVY